MTTVEKVVAYTKKVSNVFKVLHIDS